jgi:hypothetical protein
MKTSKLQCYSQDPDCGVDNVYPTPIDSFKQPALHMVVGQRTSGKSFLTSKILAQAKKDQTFDRIYIVTPSFNSNKSYFGKYIDEEDVHEPTRDSISDVIKSVEEDRDEFEAFIAKKRMYQEFKKDKHKSVHSIDEDNLMYYYENDFFSEAPKWKYKKEEPPKSLLILDDCLGSPAILQSSGLTRIATLNRHIAALKENHCNRSACGLAVIILSQSYKMNNGISRVLRENVSLLTLFKNKQQKQMDAIRDELANVVDEERFMKAYEHATEEKYGSLTIDFVPKTPQHQFRKNLNELILLD